MDTESDSGDCGSSSTSGHERSETEVNTAYTAQYAAAGATTGGSRKFTTKQTAILNSFYKNGMKGEGEQYMSFIESASKQTRLTIVQVKVGGVALSMPMHLTYCLYRDGLRRKTTKGTTHNSKLPQFTKGQRLHSGISS